MKNIFDAMILEKVLSPMIEILVVEGRKETMLRLNTKISSVDGIQSWQVERYWSVICSFTFIKTLSFYGCLIILESLCTSP